MYSQLRGSVESAAWQNISTVAVSKNICELVELYNTDVNVTQFALAVL